MFHVPKKYRVIKGPMASNDLFGNNGMFLIPYPRHSGGTGKITVIASDGENWEHVSVSRPNRCPTWDEMCKIKELFWDSDDVVIQIHPVEDEYVNNHPYCLHMWRKADTNDFYEKPPKILVGVKE